MLKHFYHKSQAFLTILGPYKKITLILFFLMIFTAFFEVIGLSLLIPLTGVILDNKMIEGGSKVILLYNRVFLEYVSEDKRVLMICGVILTIFLLKNTLIYVNSVMAKYFQNSLRKYWSASILDKYIYAEYDYIISEKRGALINNLINEPTTAAKFMAQLVTFFSSLFVVLSIYVMFLVVNLYLTLSLTIIITVVFTLYWTASRKVADFVGKKRLKLIQKITAEGEQSLNAIRQVKLFNIEDKILKEYSRQFNVLKNLLVKLSLYHNIPAPLGEILIVSGFVITLLYFKYISNISVNTIFPIMIFVVISAGKMYQNVSVLVASKLWLRAYVPSVRLVSQILANKEIKREELSQGMRVEQLTGDIIFQDISFSHSNSVAVFKDLNLRILKNKVTAIVGKSGSGKSTLVDLLCGLYKGYEGRIMIGNYELQELNLSSWRKMIGFVSQDTFLFNTSVRENVLVGNGAASDEDMVVSCKIAHAHDFIENMPKGYDAVLGDRGLKLSGGQRQRLTIARALVRAPQLLIFDEATSSLDTESERLIQESIESLRDTKTIIIISHRFSTIKNADLIYVLDDGHIIESGTYDELMAKQGFFNNMTLQQT